MTDFAVVSSLLSIACHCTLRCTRVSETVLCITCHHSPSTCESNTLCDEEKIVPSHHQNYMSLFTYFLDISGRRTDTGEATPADKLCTLMETVTLYPGDTFTTGKI
ncbi:uncharacterized protein EV420DRAFT_672969 [Desarmillaria tabescens]|uniref:Uncharacterized protein n=1 Tax=Armillaria tabescens TaxID=1929756 RepID=A0AA39T667_ARMTA|nr:uncharacterized protein EV420DRAFT_672969 [Desarmillaria tabescens]KAK0467231.1 hypothetical protein EV420DRAFT_672969 [Desarmillaria tabescens]